MSRAGVGILIDLGRLMCCDLLVGRGAESFFGCHVCSMFDSIGRGSRCWLSISDFNRWSGSRFAIVAGLNCVVDW